MRFRPANPNPALPPGHTLYLATTGGGKSQAVRQNPVIPKAGARVILWDHAGDHPGLHYHERRNFLRALATGLRSGGGFRVAYAGDQSVDAFEWFCEVVWSVLDGDRMTYVIAEELSAVCPHAGKAADNAAQLMNQGRKFGLQFHGTSQKPQEVSKTYFDQCSVKFVGQQKGLAMCRKMAAEIGVTPADIQALQPLQFYRDDGRAQAPELLTLSYRKPAGVVWKD